MVRWLHERIEVGAKLEEYLIEDSWEAPRESRAGAGAEAQKIVHLVKILCAGASSLISSGMKPLLTPFRRMGRKII